MRTLLINQVASSVVVRAHIVQLLFAHTRLVLLFKLTHLSMMMSHVLLID